MVEWLVAYLFQWCGVVWYFQHSYQGKKQLLLLWQENESSPTIKHAKTQYTEYTGKKLYSYQIHTKYFRDYPVSILWLYFSVWQGRHVKHDVGRNLIWMLKSGNVADRLICFMFAEAVKFCLGWQVIQLGGIRDSPKSCARNFTVKMLSTTKMQRNRFCWIVSYIIGRFFFSSYSWDGSWQSNSAHDPNHIRWSLTWFSSSLSRSITLPDELFCVPFCVWINIINQSI